MASTGNSRPNRSGLARFSCLPGCAFEMTLRANPNHAEFFWALALGYSFSQFSRGSLAVLSPAVMRENGWDAAYSIMASSAFFWGLAIALPVTGLALDRFGVLGVNRTLFSLAPIGCWIANTSTAIESYVLGQFITGVGCFWRSDRRRDLLRR